MNRNNNQKFVCLLSCPKNSSESFKKVKQGFLLNWKAGLDDNTGDDDIEGVEIELYTLRAKKLYTLFSKKIDKND